MKFKTSSTQSIALLLAMSGLLYACGGAEEALVGSTSAGSTGANTEQIARRKWLNNLPNGRTWSQATTSSTATTTAVEPVLTTPTDTTTAVEPVLTTPTDTTTAVDPVLTTPTATTTEPTATASVDTATNTVVQDTTATASTSFPAGARTVVATPAGQFNKFASPNGTGDGSSYATPGPLLTMVNGLVAGDRLALLGGTYSLTSTLQLSKSGTAGSPILIESYPGETAIIVQAGYPNQTLISYGIGINISGSYYKLRRLQVKNLSALSAVYVMGTGNLVEGCEMKDMPASGIVVYQATNAIVRDNVIHDLSNVGWNGNSLPLIQNGDGGWPDGIDIDGGSTGALIEYNTMYNISDDGIDAWNGSNYTIRRNLSHHNGVGPGGEGMGIKYSGPNSSGGGVVQYNFTWSNKKTGITNNGGPAKLVEYNTSWNNGIHGFNNFTVSGAVIQHNNSLGNGQGNWFQTGTVTDNSWQRAGTLAFLSTTYPSDTFLKPIANGGFADIGAWQ